MPSPRNTPLTLRLTAALLICAGAGAAAQQPANNRSTIATARALQATGPQFPGSPLLNSQPPFLAGVNVNHADGIYKEGESLRVQFIAEKEAHLYLLYHQADAATVLLFPNEAQPDSKVVARQAVRIPGEGDGFRFRVRPPLGDEVLQVIASLRPVALLEELVQKTGRAAAVSPQKMGDLVRHLSQDKSSWTEHRVFLRTTKGDVKPPPRTPSRVGLFIGIGKYQFPDYAATHVELGHSAEVMHDLLLRHGKLDPRRTLLVRDEQATRRNLEQLICRWLPSVSQPGDTVFIYFSGHAGQADTSDPSEPDGKDEMLGPYDLEGGRPGDSREQALARFRETSIVDDTLARWLEELQGRQVVLILDTCHSGGVVQGKDLGKSFFVDEAARVKDISQMNTLVLSACAADEQSLFEGTRNKTMWFTYCLSEAIEASAGKQPLSVQEAFDYSHKRMRQLLEQGNSAREQEPQMNDQILLPVPLVP